MEWKVTGARMSGLLPRGAAVKKQAAKGGALGRSGQDYLDLSEQVKRMAEQIGKMGREEKDEKSGSSLMDSFKKQLDIMNKCAKISASISAGDRVPPEDLRYLKQHDMNAYRLAMVTRKPKHDPKDKESVLSEEDVKEMEAAESVGSTAAPAAAAAESAGE